MVSWIVLFHIILIESTRYTIVFFIDGTTCKHAGVKPCIMVPVLIRLVAEDEVAIQTTLILVQCLIPCFSSCECDKDSP